MSTAATTPSLSHDEPTRYADSPSSLAFIVHSPGTVTNGLPPDVDNKLLARQKRRRTSPEDQAILETEYLNNPKPDKAARMEIVSKVALGEKEVQIWFQNRRQASRRKSRPLEPHEVVAYQSQPSLDASDRPVFSALGQAPLSTPPIQRLRETRTPPLESPPTRSTDGSLPRVRSLLAESASQEVDTTPSSSASTAYASLESSQTQCPVEQPAKPSRGHFSYGDGVDGSPPTSQETQTKPQLTRQELRRTTSKVRLSLTDGMAKVVTKTDSSPTPSPPRKAPSPPMSVASPAPPSEASFATIDSSIMGPTTRKPSNRSRDSRAWEFWADKGSHSELTDKANQEARGSAADAISLLRSASGRNILGQLSNKRSGPHGGNDATKRSKRGPLLQRSQSMQNKPLTNWRGADLKASSSPRKFKKAQSGLGIQIFATDSDKENWSPDPSVARAGDDMSNLSSDDGDARDEQTGGRRRARSTVTPGKLLVGIDAAAAELSSDPEDDAEISSFMNGGDRARQRKSNSASEEEELDCVQGLLSLSQGAWK